MGDNYSVPIGLRVAWNMETEEMIKEGLRPLMNAVDRALVDLELSLSLKTGKPKRQTREAIMAAKTLRAALDRARKWEREKKEGK